MIPSIVFLSWPIWAKLSFVLGSLFVLVLGLAAIIKLHKFLKIRKLDRLSIRDVERAEMIEGVRSSDEIPFGAKAMLEDPDVEGVWNSRASTPLQSPVLAPRNPSPTRQSLNLFSRSRRNSSVSSLGNFISPAAPSNTQPVVKVATPLSPHEDPESNTNTVLALDSSFAAVSGHCRIQNTDTTYDVASMPRRRSVTIRANSVSRPSAEVSRSYEDDASSNRADHRRRNKVFTDPTPETPKQRRRGRTLLVNGPCPASEMLERTPATRKALDRMEAHRKFHAAESGQLQPRPRTTEKETLIHKYSVSDTRVSDQDTSRAVSWPITTGEVLVDFHATQKVQTKRSPQVVPFRAFVEMHPPPEALSRLPPSAWTGKTQEMLNEKLEAQTPKKRIIIKNEKSSNLDGSRYVISRRDSKNATEGVSLLGTQQRSVNGGFEVLPAGSLIGPTKVKDFGYSREPLREASNDTGKCRKLQKRSRSSSIDRRSSVDTIRQVTF